MASPPRSGSWRGRQPYYRTRRWHGQIWRVVQRAEALEVAPRKVLQSGTPSPGSGTSRTARALPRPWRSQGMRSTFQGSIVAMVTPFRNGRIDEDKIAELVEFHVGSGTDGIVPCGTTGESPTLSHDEHKRVVEVVIHVARGRVPIIA